MRKLSMNNNRWIRSFLPWLWLLLCHLAKWFPDKFFISFPWSEGLCSSPFFLNPDDNMRKVISHLQCQRQEWRMEVCLWRRRSRNNMKSLTGMQPVDSGREDYLLLLDWVKMMGIWRGEKTTWPLIALIHWGTATERSIIYTPQAVCSQHWVACHTPSSWLIIVDQCGVKSKIFLTGLSKSS